MDIGFFFFFKYRSLFMKTNLFLVPEGKKSVKKKKFRLNGKSFFFLISWVNKRKKHFVLLFLNARLRLSHF